MDVQHSSASDHSDDCHSVSDGDCPVDITADPTDFGHVEESSEFCENIPPLRFTSIHQLEPVDAETPPSRQSARTFDNIDQEEPPSRQSARDFDNVSEETLKSGRPLPGSDYNNDVPSLAVEVLANSGIMEGEGTQPERQVPDPCSFEGVPPLSAKALLELETRKAESLPSRQSARDFDTIEAETPPSRQSARTFDNIDQEEPPSRQSARDFDKPDEGPQPDDDSLLEKLQKATISPECTSQEPAKPDYKPHRSEPNTRDAQPNAEIPPSSVSSLPDSGEPRANRIVIHHAKAFNNASLEEEEIDFSNAFNPDAHVDSSHVNDYYNSAPHSTNPRSDDHKDRSPSHSDYEEFDIGTNSVHRYDTSSTCRYYTDNEEDIHAKESAGAMAETDSVSKRPGLLGRQLQKATHCVKSLARKPYVAATKFTNYCKKKLT
ncbi:hypothetical protein BaOVIS_017660 [Babesia ovis]|uniref:Uncharacterized protein n=1 Tax=Babesia ovis TaxID=5869 RepID=A0A9W5TDC1_BABOV|nr:hypothetical protein BaOVIS_017660 [Babesia ovis]